MQLPLIKPFELLEGQYTDVRGDQRLLGFVQEAQVQMVNELVPRDILCNVGSTKREDQNKARLEAFTRSGGEFDQDTKAPIIEPALMAEEIAKYQAIEQVRHDAAIMAGDVDPITFAIEKNGQFWGAFQWFAIRIIPDSDPNPPSVKIRAGYFPAMPGLDPEALARESIDIVVAFIRQDYMMEFDDGRMLDVVQATNTVVEDAGRPDTQIVQYALTRLQEIGDGINFSLVDDPTQLGRKRMRITDAGIPSLEEPEIDELIASRPVDPSIP